MTAFHEHAFTGPVNRTANCVDPGTAARLPTLWLGFLLAENNQRCLEPPLSLASATPFRAPYSLSETPELLQVLPWLCTPSHLAAIASLRPLRFHRPASCGHHPPPHMADRGPHPSALDQTAPACVIEGSFAYFSHTARDVTGARLGEAALPDPKLTRAALLHLPRTLQERRVLKLRSASISFPPHAQRPASITSELDCDATANRWTPTDGRSYRQVGNYQRVVNLTAATDRSQVTRPASSAGSLFPDVRGGEQVKQVIEFSPLLATRRLVAPRSDMPSDGVPTSEEDAASSVERQRLPSIRELLGRFGLPSTPLQSVLTYQDDQASVTSTLPPVAHALASADSAYHGAASLPTHWAPTTTPAPSSMFADPPTALSTAYDNGAGRYHSPSPYARYRRRITTTTRLRTHTEAVESGLVVPYESVSERASSTSESSRGTSSPMLSRPQSSPAHFSSLTSDHQVAAGVSRYLTHSPPPPPPQGSEALSPPPASLTSDTYTASGSTSRRGMGSPTRQQQQQHQRWQLPLPSGTGATTTTTRRGPRRPSSGASSGAGASTAAAAAAAAGRDLLLRAKSERRKRSSSVKAKCEGGVRTFTRPTEEAVPRGVSKL
ncbi:hypothetical protein C6P46_000935 [Rhodotorula mucilaginosa]|uniref:Uncharacterized protein n=1 Tax=Rhodotorula mucilaginosa TaxID=5537 RepID=A0A9P6W7C2_RHOMI|nr:hypothetical protein C6P46_000935 [Rhodotorula mucilaginosa]